MALLKQSSQSGEQIAGPTGGNNTAGTTVNMTAPTGGVATGAQSVCDPTQIAGAVGGGQNATANTTTITAGEAALMLQQVTLLLPQLAL